MWEWLTRLFGRQVAHSDTTTRQPARPPAPGPSYSPRVVTAAQSVPRSAPPPRPSTNPPSVGRSPSARRTDPGKIKWGGGELRPDDLVGAFDPLVQTPLQPGERVHVCRRCQTAYHAESFAFLLDQNYGA